MTRRVKRNKSIFFPITDSFLSKISSTDSKLKRKVLKYASFLLVLIVGYSMVSGSYGIPRIIKLELTKKSLSESNRKLTAELIDAVKLREMLLNDGEYIEYIARTRYFMVKPNETIFRYHGH